MMQRNISRLFALLSLSIAFLATPLIARAATYYVATTGSDSNPGTQAAPWRTIQHSAGVAVAGDTVILSNGRYVESQIQMVNSGSSGKPITFQAQNRWGAVLSSTSGCNPAISVYASYITINNIEITRDPSNAACPYYTSANVGVRAWNKNNPTVGGNTSSTYTNFIADGVKVDDTVQFDFGIKTNQDYTIIQNSVLYEPLEAFDIQSPIFRSNTLYALHFNGAQDPIIFLKGGVRDGQVYNNIIYASLDGQAAIMIGGNASCCWWDPAAHIEAYNTVAYNNVIIDQTSDVHGIALVLSGASNSGFINNVTIGWVQLGFDTGSANGYPPNPPTINPTFANNIFLGNGHPATGGYFGWAGAYTGQLTVDHNDFYNYSSALPTQTNAITGNPLFVNPASDWHLQPGSPAIGSGVALSKRSYNGATIDISHDFDGVVRPVPWDLGIYKMGAAIPPPPPPPPSPTSPDLITASLSYNSTTGIFTSVVLNQGTGPTPSGIVIGNGFYVDGNFVTWGAVPGPLAAGASVTIDSSGGGAYTITSGTHTITAVADDVNRFPESNETNNTLSQTITIGSPTSPDLVTTSLSYNSATRLFTSVVKNQGAGDR